MNSTIFRFAAGLAASVASAQLTVDQKVFELQVLASLYAKQYAPYEWKRDVMRFDLYNLAPWIQRVRQTRNDVEFYETCALYVAGLNDIHSYYEVPSEFQAYLGLGADIYDGKVIIDGIDRGALPARQYPFAIGDELVTVDGRPVEEVLADLGRFVPWGDARATRRYAADYLGFRPQAYFPTAVDLKEAATIEVRRRESGQLETYTLPWEKTGRELTSAGPVPSPRLFTSPRRWSETDEAGPVPRWRKPAIALSYSRASRAQRSVRGFGALNPVFSMPQGFVQRLGRNRGDVFFSGTYASGGKRIGFIRIGDLAPVPFELLGTGLRQFDAEIRFFQQNTDGLVVDVMRNPGGFGCYAQALLSWLIPERFRGFGAEVRATLEWVHDFDQAVADAEESGAEQWEIDLLQSQLDQVAQAYGENRGRTGPISLCGPSLDVDPATGSSGSVIAYTKPVILLADEFTTSAADIVAAVFQDAGRGPVVGWRTAGAGGNIAGVPSVGFYAEGRANVTQSMLTRPNTVAPPGFPASHYIENVGVHPDIVLDYMTMENLLESGRPFVEAFTANLVDLIESSGR